MTESESADSESNDAPSGARMTLEPDSIREAEAGPSLECPGCGATVTVGRVVETGRCPNSIDEDDIEVAENAGQVRRPECSAELGLELVWEG